MRILLDDGTVEMIDGILLVVVLSDERITELKNRIDRSRKIRSAKPNRHIVERSRRSGRSSDTKLLGQ